MEQSSDFLTFPDSYSNITNEEIDYVIVYSDKKMIRSRHARSKMKYFVQRLEELDITYKASRYSADRDIVFLKIHVPLVLLEEYASLEYLELAYKSKSPTMIEPKPWLPCLHSCLTHPDPNNEEFQRAKETLGKMKPDGLTQGERVLLTYIILRDIRFGKGVNQQGIDRLVKTGAVLTAYPLHEGSADWTTEGPLTDRQLLFRYWGNLNFRYKMQPLRIIEKYFGPQMAFFYAYLELTTGMTIIASILGIIFFFIGVVAESESAKAIGQYICSSDKLICPTCNPSYCKAHYLRKYCGLKYNLSQVLDNVEMFLLGICITLWGTVFLEMWKRTQAYYQLEWNLHSLETHAKIRTGYEKRAHLLKMSLVSNELEHTMETSEANMRVLLSTASVLLLIFLVVGVELLVVMIKMKLKIMIYSNTRWEIILNNSDTIVNLLGSGFIVGLIMLFDRIYGKVAQHLTDFENPRTQREYDNSFILKSFLFAFANNYTMIFYIAFFKGRFYTNPGDENMHKIRGAYMADTCGPGGCSIDLTMQLMFILGIKHIFLKGAGKFFLKVFLVLYKKNVGNQRSRRIKRPQWENDYILKPFHRYVITKQYTEIIVRHGFVLFFTAVCPFTPILTLIVNLMEMKLYAYAYTTLYKRPVPRKLKGIGMFDYILQCLTWFGVTMNGVIILMSKDFVMRSFYTSGAKLNLTSYMEFRFAAFDMKDYKRPYSLGDANETVCYFTGYRYPPDHPQKYQKRPETFKYYAWGLMMVVIYLHVVFLVSRLIGRFIPQTSSEVRDYLNTIREEDRKQVRKFRKLHQFQSELHVLKAESTASLK